jgi:hypothetical protein
MPYVVMALILGYLPCLRLCACHVSACLAVCLYLDVLLMRSGCGGVVEGWCWWWKWCGGLTGGGGRGGVCY